MLYDGAHRFLNQAAIAMGSGDVPITHAKLRRAELIITHLRDTLDLEQGEVAERLRAIYDFSIRHLGEARAQRDPDRIEQVDNMLGELREAWAQAVRA
jgi:flagellar protein FliS